MLFDFNKHKFNLFFILFSLNIPKRIPLCNIGIVNFANGIIWKNLSSGFNSTEVENTYDKIKKENPRKF